MMSGVRLKRGNGCVGRQFYCSRIQLHSATDNILRWGDFDIGGCESVQLTERRIDRLSELASIRSRKSRSTK